MPRRSSAERAGRACRPRQERSRAATAALATAGALSLAGGLAAAGYLAYRLVAGRRGARGRGREGLRHSELVELLARAEGPSLRLAEEAARALAARTTLEASLPESDEEKSALVARMLALYCQRAAAVPLVVCGTLAVGTTYYACVELVLDRYGLRLDEGAAARLGEDVRQVVLAAAFSDAALQAAEGPVAARVKERLVELQPPEELAEFLGGLTGLGELAGGLARASRAAAGLVREQYASATSVLRLTHELAGGLLADLAAALGGAGEGVEAGPEAKAEAQAAAAQPAEPGKPDKPGKPAEPDDSPLAPAALPAAALAQHLGLLKAQFAADIDTLIPTSSGVAFAYYARPLQNMSYEAYYAGLGPAAEPLALELHARLEAAAERLQNCPPEHGPAPAPAPGPAPAPAPGPAAGPAAGSPSAPAPGAPAALPEVKPGPAPEAAPEPGPEPGPAQGPAELSSSALQTSGPHEPPAAGAADRPAEPAAEAPAAAPQAPPAGAAPSPVKFSSAELLDL